MHYRRGRTGALNEKGTEKKIEGKMRLSRRYSVFQGQEKTAQSKWADNGKS
jgi:hypothetical protein